MKRDDLIILLVATLLLAAMIWTFFFGGEQSRHGTGMIILENPAAMTSLPISLPPAI